jgi:putative SOS response-associated peptidase YedK
MREVMPTFEDLLQAVQIAPRYNIASGQDVPIVRLNAGGHPTVNLVRWGLIPSWTKGKPKTQPINARA